MATPPRLWSLSALSAEFGLDRRTTAKRMASVPPDGLLARNAAWFLSTAAPVLLSKDGGGANPVDSIAKRAGGPFTTSQNPVDEALATVLVMLAARLPAEVGATAVRAGAPVELAEEIFKGFGIRACAMVDEMAEECGILWASPNHFDLPEPPDWDALVSQNSA
jgi:hypothetical protein